MLSQREGSIAIDISTVTPQLKLINLKPPLTGYDEFFAVFLFQSEKTALIDVGPRVAEPNLFSALAELNISPEKIDYIVLSHIHIDHSGALGAALKKMANASIIVHERGIDHLVDPTLLWEASVKTMGDTAIKYGEPEPVPRDRLTAATDGMKVDLGQGTVLEIYLTPGHALHHISLYDRTNGLLIAGEAAGTCSNGFIRPSTPPPFKLEIALASIDKLLALNPQKICYGHFGCYDQAVERLQAYRQKLLDWHDTVRSTVKAGGNAEDILTLLRQKDPDLYYLAGLDNDTYTKECSALIRSIKGIMGAASKAN